MNEYEIWDMNKFIEYNLQSDVSCNVDKCKEMFKQLSKGFNFIIAIFNMNKRDYIFLSVTFFNDEVVNNG